MEDWLKYFGAGVISLGGLLGIGKLAQMGFARRWSRQDTQDKRANDLHVTVESKKIDQDTHAFDHVMKRLEKVEDQLQEVQGKLSKEMADNSRCQAESEALKKDNARQELEIKRLRDRVHDLAEKVQVRDSQIVSFQNSLDTSNKMLEALRNELTETTKELNKLKNANKC